MRKIGKTRPAHLGLLLFVLVLVSAAGIVPALADTAPQGEVLIAVGDIANCGSDPKNNPDPQKSKGVIAVSTLLSKVLPTNGRLAVMGDLAYSSGTPDQFHYCYDKYLSAFKSQTYPVPGNHEYFYNCNPQSTSCDASPYFTYFGSRAGSIGKGYYSYDYAGWHIIALNSSGSEPVGDPCGWVSCTGNSPQGIWLKQDLKSKAAQSAKCTLAYWHHPRFSSGAHGNNPEVEPFWRILSKFGVDVVLNGHSHDYERFAPMDAAGKKNGKTGMREFVVGTGGGELADFHKPVDNSQVRIKQFGVLKLTLYPDHYDWEFLTTPSGTADSGTGKCH